MIQLDHISFGYTKNRKVLDDINTGIGEGITLLLGPNGSGKTTLLKIISGVLKPQSGQCLIDDINSACRLPRTLERLFYYDDKFSTPFKTVREFCRAHSPFYKSTFSAEDFEANLAAFGLTGNESLKGQSLGRRKQSYAAYVLALGAEILLLDEPANGLDIEASKIFYNRLAHCMRPGQTIIISTHILGGVSLLADRLAVLGNERLLIDTALENISGAIKFIHSYTPIDGALYQELNSGLWHGIVTNDSAEDSDIDFALLYSALMSPNGYEISTLLNKRN